MVMGPGVGEEGAGVQYDFYLPHETIKLSR